MRIVGAKAASRHRSHGAIREGAGGRIAVKRPWAALEVERGNVAYES